MFGAFHSEPRGRADDQMVGDCPTCGHSVRCERRRCVEKPGPFGELVDAVECPKCRERTPKIGGPAVAMRVTKQRVLDFQI